MADPRNTVGLLLERIILYDPALYELLFQLAQELFDLKDVVIPTEVNRILEEVRKPAPNTHPVTAFYHQILPRSVRFFWENGSVIAGTVWGPDPNIKAYEIRKEDSNPLNKGWDKAFFQTRTNSLQADINPLPIGTHRFFIRTINADGKIQELPGFDDPNIILYPQGYEPTATVIINPIPGPVITPQIIDNNVLLSWVAPFSDFEIVYYNIYRNDVLIGTQNTTFFAYFEVSSGTYTYSIEAVDLAGNVGTRGYVTVDLGQPPDFVLEDSRVSSLNGTKVNVVLISGPKLLCCVNVGETWTTHFSSHGWNNIQDQVNAGYNVYGQPYLTTGSYTEIIDYGAEFTNLVVNIDWSTTPLLGIVGVNATIEASLDGISWGIPTLGRSAFFSSMRYVRITIIFTPADDKSLIEFYNLRIFLNTKLVLTSGNITSLATDNYPATPSSPETRGTYVPFIKPYKDVNSITLTTNSKQPISAIYAFQDIPNPDGFKVMVFDSSGNRIDQEVSWKVRGTL